MNITIRAALTAALLPIILAACKKETAIEKLTTSPAAADEGSADPVKIAVTVDDPKVQLGADIVFHVKLTNSGKSDVQVNVPRLDRNSVTFRVRRPDGGIAKVERIHAELDERRRFVFDAPEAKKLAAGESLSADVPLVAIENGKLAFTASYVRQGAQSAIVAPAVEVEVSPSDPKKPRLGVHLETTLGPYTAVYRPDVAYCNTESNAALVKKGFFTGLKFHRVINGFMAQGGDPAGDGSSGPGYYLPLEANLKLRHTRGVMSMARTGIPDTAGSQFFLMFATRPDLDQGRYTTFAEMTEGEETLKKMEAAKKSMSQNGEPSVPVTPIVIKSATLVNLP
jgi:cyclophilin family peptidyl-prolyl cis-trans isomerase